MELKKKFSQKIRGMKNGIRFRSKYNMFILIGVLLAGYAFLDGFDLGVGAIYLFVKGDNERRIMLNSIGPVWDGNEVWLVTGGGATFRSFPHVYATVFSGFYTAFYAISIYANF
jgi:cytochrome d ubiquinol oxidase subunit II